MGLSDHFYRLLWRSGLIPARWNHLAYRRLRKLGQAPTYPFEIDFFGRRYSGDLANDIDSFVFYYGAYEKPNLFFLRDLFQSLGHGPLTFVDVGANVGQHALFAADHASHVHAFEPCPELRRRIDEKVRLNRLENVTIHGVGLGARDEDLLFHRSGANSVMMGSFLSDFQPTNTASDHLPVRQGDSYFAARGIKRVDVMKIDVEGFERPVLHGLRATLTGQRPVVMVEISWRDKAPYIPDIDTLRTLLPENYRLFLLRGPAVAGLPRQRYRARRSGDYEVLPLTRDHGKRSDVVACPVEKLAHLPRSRRTTTALWRRAETDAVTEIGFPESKAA